MSYQWAIALAVHQLGALFWVGGMFFAHIALRPAANQVLELAQRLPLMLAVFRRFFAWVWAAILFIWSSGLWIFIVMHGGKAGFHVHVMIGVAALMTALFLLTWFLPYRKMKAAVDLEDWLDASRRLKLIRGLVFTNLLLGLATAVLGVAGPKL